MDNATAQYDFDVLIAGGGMVGASLACALGGQALRVGVIEAVPLNTQHQPSYDDRTIALAYGTRRIFTAMGVWSRLQSGVTPIARIHVSDRGHFGALRMDCREEHIEALGYVVESRRLGQALAETLSIHDNITLLCPASLQSFDTGDDGVTVTIDEQGTARTLTARLLIAADGGKSAVREQLGITTTRWDYGQSAIITNVTPGHPHDNTAYERFTDSGPLALLPMSEGRCAVVWTHRTEDAERTMALDDAGFLAALQARFGYRLGRLRKVGKRSVYPLQLIRAREHIRARVALIGNAAHTLHPVAGQGFNLGLRDVAALADVLCSARGAGEDIGSIEVLRRYEQWRRRDHRRAIAFTDGLVRIFSNSHAPLSVARGLGMTALDLFPGMKHGIVRHAMGVSGRLPRLARGIPL